MGEAIVCVGRLREKYWANAAAEYQKRLSRFTRLEVIEMPDLPEPQNSSDALRQQIMQKEGQEILACIKQTDYVIAMCIDAPQMTSEELAAFISSQEGNGRRLTFVIGGSLGLSSSVVSRADKKLSMSKMTFPHQLARVMVLEQLYRAHKINANEKYHK